MALQKSLEYQRTGFMCNYWKIGECKLESNSTNGSVTLLGYKDKDARDAGKAPVESKQYSFGGYYTLTEMDKSDNNVLKMSYAAIKAYDPDYADAVDV